MNLPRIIYIVCVPILNILIAWSGHSNVLKGDKDILLPLSSSLFLFYSLLIYLPQSHFKIVKFQLNTPQTSVQNDQKQNETFPLSFFIALISLALVAAIDGVYKNYKISSKHGEVIESNQVKRQKGQQTDQLRIQKCQILRYLLSISLFLSNISISYFLSVQQHSNLILNQTIIIVIFGFLTNYAFGYLLGWSDVNIKLTSKLSLFGNIGIIVGYILGNIIPLNLVLLLIPCICSGILIYCSSFICLPRIFSNGENHTQDKYRYGSVATSLLLTILYYPLCYLLRV